MIKVLSMKNGMYYSHTKGKKSFAQIKAIKESEQGVLSYELTNAESQKLDDGWTPSIVGGNVVLTAPTPAWLDGYKAQSKHNQKAVVKGIFKENMFDAVSIEAYKTTLNNYLNNTVDTGIDSSADKPTIDAFIDTIVWPLP